MFRHKCNICGSLEDMDRAEGLRVLRSGKPHICAECKGPRIYTDGTHLITNGPEEMLHEFARTIGLRRSWFQTRGRYHHYDVFGSKRERALAGGAVRVTSKELIAILKGAGKVRSRKRRAA